MQAAALLTRPLAAPLSDADIQALRERNEERARRAAAALGTRFVYHPSNQARRTAALLQGSALLNDHRFKQ